MAKTPSHYDYDKPAEKAQKAGKAAPEAKEGEIPDPIVPDPTATWVHPTDDTGAPLPDHQLRNSDQAMKEAIANPAGTQAKDADDDK